MGFIQDEVEAVMLKAGGSRRWDALLSPGRWSALSGRDSPSGDDNSKTACRATETDPRLAELPETRAEGVHNYPRSQLPKFERSQTTGFRSRQPAAPGNSLTSSLPTAPCQKTGFYTEKNV